MSKWADIRVWTDIQSFIIGQTQSSSSEFWTPNPWSNQNLSPESVLQS